MGRPAEAMWYRRVAESVVAFQYHEWIETSAIERDNANQPYIVGCSGTKVTLKEGDWVVFRECGRSRMSDHEFKKNYIAERGLGDEPK